MSQPLTAADAPAAPPPLSPRTRLTFRYECWRAVAAGVLETGPATFLMFVAVRHFYASAGWKSLLAVFGFAGFVLTPAVVSLVTVLRWKPSRAASFLLTLGAAGFLLATAIPTLEAFVIGSVFALTCSHAAVPLFTQVYQDNYPAALRGKLFSISTLIRIGVAVLFGYAASAVLGDTRLAYYQWLTAIFCLCLAFSGACLFRVPSEPLADPGPEARNPFYALRFIVEDKTFRNTLISWMLIGLANLMMVALRVEYLANPRYHNGRVLSAEMVALLSVVIPNIARLCMSPIWGHLFDRLNFFLLRISINVGFAVAIATFFTGSTLTGLITGAIIFGISNAGGDLCWALWVTKVAPPHRVAHYMSVHTLLNGIRGIAAPFLAFYLVERMSLTWMATITGALILVACLILVPELTAKRPLRREVEEQLSD